MLHVLLVEADDENDLEELLITGNYIDIVTPIDSLDGIIESSVKVSVQTDKQFDRYEVKLEPFEYGLRETSTDHIRV